MANRLSTPHSKASYGGFLSAVEKWHMPNAYNLEQNRTEQNRTEQNRTEQNRTEQNRTEQNRTDKDKIENHFLFSEFPNFLFHSNNRSFV
jgi:hypothetical protein